MINALDVQTRRPAMQKKTSRLVEMKAAAIERKAGATKVLGRTVFHPPDYQAVVGLDVGD
jgi:hypothetical protein